MRVSSESVGVLILLIVALVAGSMITMLGSIILGRSCDRCGTRHK